MNQPAHSGLLAPLRIALQSALGRHLDPIHLGHPAEVLEQRTIGQADGKAAKVFHDQSAGDVTAQSAARMDLNLALGLGGNVFEFGPSLPVLEAVCNELRFDTAVKQKLIDAQELVAQTLIVDIAFDGGQRGPEQLLNEKKWGWH